MFRTSPNGLFWYLSLPKTDRHIRQKSADKGHIVEKLEQGFSNVHVEIVPPIMATCFLICWQQQRTYGYSGTSSQDLYAS